MPAQTFETASTARFELGSILDVRAAQRLRTELCEALAKGETLTIDGKSVERISTACVQVLLAYVHAAAAAGTPASLAQPSRALAEAFCNLGLKSILKTWEGE